MTQPAIRYSRFSTEKQEKGDSLTRQQRACEGMATRRGWTIHRVIEDLGRSAWHGHHLRDGHLGRFANEVRQGSITPNTILIVERTDRLSRQGAMALFDWLRDMANHGLTIAIADGEHVFDAASFNGDVLPILTIILSGKQDKQYSDAISDRSGSAWVRKRKAAEENNTLISRRVPGWIDLSEDGKRTLNKHRTRILNLIFEWTRDGHGGPTIVQRLNGMGEKPWGHHHKVKAGWETSYIGQLINGINPEGDYQPRTRVNGKLVDAGPKIEGYYPRAVDAALVAAARAARATRRNTGGRGRSTFEYMTTGMMKCQHCGSTMSHRRSDVGGVKRLNIQCYSVMRGMDCPNRGVMRVEKFEETILDRILPLALDDQFFARSDETYALANDVAAIQKLIADKRAQKGRAVKLLMTPDFAEDTDIMAQAATAQRIITQSEDRLRVAQQALNTARGSVEPAEHLKRVTAVRGAINDPDPAVRVPARAKVHAALKAIVEVVLCDNIDNGEKTFRVSVIGGLIGFKVAAATGEIVRQWNITGRLDSNPTWARAVNHRDNGPAVLADVMRRQG